MRARVRASVSLSFLRRGEHCDRLRAKRAAAEVEKPHCRPLRSGGPSLNGSEQ